MNDEARKRVGKKEDERLRERERLQQPVRQLILFNAKVSVKLHGIAPVL